MTHYTTDGEPRTKAAEILMDTVMPRPATVASRAWCEDRMRSMLHSVVPSRAPDSERADMRQAIKAAAAEAVGLIPADHRAAAEMRAIAAMEG